MRIQNPPASPGARQAQAGFSLIEAMISLGILALLLVTVFSVSVETSAFVGDNDLNYSVQSETNRAFLRMSEILRKSGWRNNGGVTYPRVTGGGTELEFMSLQDLDGNGYAFDADTGELEWSPTVFSIKLDPATETLAVYNGGVLLWVLGRFIQSASFSTYLESSDLAFREISVTIQSQRTNRDGKAIGYTSTGSVNMRN